MTHDAITVPKLSNLRLVLEVHTHVADAPLFRVGKFNVTVFKVVALYRKVSSAEPWEFIDIIVHGIWADGNKQGEIAHRRYTRGKIDHLHGWMLDFIKNNDPEK